jgi:hypothetical protein
MMKVTERKLKEFDPSKLITDFVDSGLDAATFESLDETAFKKAPNFLTFCLDPDFLNATILPKQIEIGTKLFGDYCPKCSEPGYIDTLYDQDISDIRKNVCFLEHGLCPSCGTNRYELIQENFLDDYNELACCMGQRCIPKDSYIYTHRGLVEMREVERGDILSHGYAFKLIDSGKLTKLTLKTELGWDLSGSKDSHIVPVLQDDGTVKDTSIAEITVGDKVMLVSPDLWPSIEYEVRNKFSVWPFRFDQRLCGFLGLFCRDFWETEETIEYHDKDTAGIVREMLSEIFDVHATMTDKGLSISNKRFIEWFATVTEGRRVPEGVYRTTKEAATMFIQNYLSKDWYFNDGDDKTPYLKHTIEAGVDTLKFKMLLLNIGILPVVKKAGNLEILYSAYPTSQNEKIQALINKGYFPVRVTGISESEAVEMMDIVVPDANVYVADGFLHHNSGKSKLIGLIGNYAVHKMLCIPNPIRTFNLSAGDVLGMSFAGLSEDKVEKNLWSAFVGFMDASPWFQKYHQFLLDKGKEMKKDLFIKRGSYIKYDHKKLLIDFYGSKGTAFRGDTRFFGSIDEVSWMASGEEAQGSTMGNADAIYTSINNSLSTLRMKRKQVFSDKNYDIPPILIANISSPRSSKDKMMKQIKAAQSNPKILGIQVPTWEANPDYTEEALLKEYASTDSAEFYRDFGASPPLESNPFLSDPKAIDKIAVLNKCGFYSFTVQKDNDALGDKFLFAKMEKFQGDNTPRLMSFDLGSTTNAFGVCIFKLDSESRPVLESALVIKPRNGFRVHLPWVYDHLTVPMVKNFNVKYVFFDKWQSLDQVTRLRDMGVEAHVYSLKYADIDNVRGMINNRSVLIPKMQRPLSDYLDSWKANDDYLPDEISAALGIQCLTARDMGIRFIKPTVGDDDLFRAFCLGVNRLTDFKVIKGMVPTKGPGMSQGGGLGVVHSLKGGSAVVSGSGVGLVGSRGGSRRR